LYVIAMAALGLHLYHGAWSSLRTLGLARPKRDPLHRPIATVLAIVVAVGFALIPVAVMAGWVR
jgi:succinate dehydrogenase / fumarate reductase cytochrome b subunit